MQEEQEYTNAGDSLGLAPAAEQKLSDTRMDALVGKLLVVDPQEETSWTVTIEGRQENADVTVATVYEVDSVSGTLTDHGLIPVFWEAVRNALRRQRSRGVQRIVGRIMKLEGKRYFQVVPPTPEEYEMVVKAVQDHEAF